MTCLFCRIVSKDIPATIIGESEHALAFRDIAPQAPVHVLVIPKQHYHSMNEITDGAALASVALLAQQVARELGVDASGYRLVVNTGADGGQTVHHLHMHLLAGRQLQWPPG